MSSSLYLLNGVVVSWKCKKQATMTLNSTGSKIVSLADGVKKTIHLSDFLDSVGCPIVDVPPTFENTHGTIKSIKDSQLHENIRHLVTHISWPNGHYVMGIVKLLYNKTSLKSVLECGWVLG
jgi:hypothetical protein